MRSSLFYSLAGEDNSEFLPSITKGATTTRNIHQLGCDHLENLVANIVAVIVVEMFEVIDIDHGYGITAAKAGQLLVQGSP